METKNGKAKVTLYYTVSLDGYIATPDGAFDWNAADYSLEPFLSRCQKADAVVMGRKAWDAYVVAEMAPLHPGSTYVLSSAGSLSGDTSSVSIVTLQPKALLEKLEQAGHQDILLVGGSQTSSDFLKANLIDEMILDVQPILLGAGLPMLKLAQRQPMQLLDVKQMGPVTHCHYRLQD